MRHGSLGRKRFYLISYIALHIHAHMHITISLGHRTLEIYMKLSAVEPRHLHRLSAYVPFRATSAEDILCRVLGLVGISIVQGSKRFLYIASLEICQQQSCLPDKVSA